MREDKVTMPFTGETPEELGRVFDSIKDCPLPLEVFDAFLAQYLATGGDLEDSRFFAMCEWDC